ncbi:MAG TPA: Ig-like domain-containing protein [Tepidisphaeraceae bacterium]|nr:Ig-like domain-containing protein [Tepidisphaeraceae bacterium]
MSAHIPHASPTFRVVTRKGSTQPAATVGPNGFTPAQMRHAYGLDDIFLNGNLANGTGQTVAIIDAYDNPKFVSSSNAAYATSDLFKFNQQFGLPQFGTPGGPTFTKVNQTGGTSYPAGSKTWGEEIALDVEWVHALAPGANIVLVEATNNSLANLVTAAVGWARTQIGISVISMSFGGTEFADETTSSYDGKFTTPAGHNGITFLASTGDNSAPGGYPAYSPNVVAVGGTTLSLSGGNYAGETGWNKSGGGISAYEAKPSYQSSVTQSSTRRTIPDIAFDADPASGVPIYDSYSQGTAAPWIKIGGTSLSAPAWAAFIAMTNQVRVAAGLGTLNGRNDTLPMLYSMPQSNFHDITSGNNGFAAAAGYDLLTGRGTPRTEPVLGDLLSGKPTIPDLAATSDTGSSASDNLTKLSTPHFVGLAPSGSTVEILSDGIVVGSGLAANGSYDIALSTPLTNGQHNITSRIGAITSAGAVSVNIDLIAPTVTGSTFFYDTGHSVQFDFSDDVSSSMSPGAATVTAVGGGPNLVAGYGYGPGNSATFQLPISMSDGYYNAKLIASSVVDAAGNSMAADFIFGFFVLGGDANHDGTVDLTDMIAFSPNWLTGGKTFSQGDFNYDGTVDARDLTILANHWQQTLLS